MIRGWAAALVAVSAACGPGPAFAQIPAVPVAPTGAAATVEDTAPFRLEPRVLALGDVPRGKLASGKVELVNTGSDRLQYVGAGAPRPGVIVIASPPVVEPGGRATVQINIETASLAESESFSIALTYARAGEPFIVRIPVQLGVETIFLATPSEIDLGTLHAGATATALVRIAPLAREEVNIVAVEASPELRAMFRDIYRHEGRAAPEYKVDFVAPRRVGLYRGHVRFTLASESIESITIAVRAILLSDVTCAPQEVDLGRVVRGRGEAQAAVTIRGGPGRPRVALLGARAEGAGLSIATATATGATAESAIEVRVALAVSALPAGPFGGVVRIYLNRPEMPTLAIPVRGEVVEPLRLEPPAVYLDLTQPGASREAILDVRPEPGVDLGALRVSSGSPLVGARVEHQGELYRIRVTMSPTLETSSPVFSAELLVRCSTASEYPMSVRVFAQLR